MTRSDLTTPPATAALELLPDGVLVVHEGEVLLANRALHAASPGADLVGPRRARRGCPQAGASEVEVDGRPVHVTVAPCELGSVVTVRDADAPAVLAHRASHDGLTGAAEPARVPRAPGASRSSAAGR